MAERVGVTPRANDGGWSLVAGVGLLTAGFLLGRLASTSTQTPAQPRNNQDVAALVTETDDRGRLATSPADIPVKGWKDIFLRVYGNIGAHRILALAAGMTYYSILAIFPALAALVAIYGLFSDPSSIAKQLDTVGGFTPGGAIDVAREQLTRVASKSNQTLSLTFIVGLALALWSANAAMKSLFDTLNVVYREEEKRGFLKLNAISLAFTVAAVGCVVLALGVIVVLPVALNYLWLTDAAELLIRLVRWPVMFIGLALALACIYRFGPSRNAPRWGWITSGSMAAALLWLAASALFSWYAANFGTFNETYGSLGAAIGLMTWLWISAIAILLGAELNAEMEHQTMCDSTTGFPKPMGMRGAQMADTIGEQQGG